MDDGLAQMGMVALHSRPAGPGIAEIIGFVLVIVALRWASRIADSVVQAFSGEQRSLMPRGFLRHSTRVRRTIELQTIVSRLAMITRMNLPLRTALEAAAVGEHGKVKHFLSQLGQQMADGSPVSSALEAVMPGCPTPLLAALRRAESTGQLSHALDQQERLINSMVEMQFNSTAHMRHAVTYVLVMLLFCGVMVFGIAAFLIPQFKEIFLDFHVRLPAITIALLHFSDWFAVNIGAVLIATVLICLGVICGVSMTRRMSRTSTRAQIVAGLRSRLPIISSLDFGLGMARAIRAMALELRSGTSSPFSRTFSPVVSQTNSLRTQLDTFSQRVANGVAPHAAARDAGLGDVFVCALRMVERGEDAERTLGHAADYYETTAYRWWHALAAISGPLATVAMGVMVGFVALAFFMPLIALIDSVAGTF